MMIVKNKIIAKKLKLLRNHGLVSRNKIKIFGVNSRLDTIQAVVANHLLKKLPNLTKKRRVNAFKLDKGLSDIKEIKIPNRYKDLYEVFHLYNIQVKKRDKLVSFLKLKSIDAKMHYPIPMHLQEPSKKLKKYKKGDFPIAEQLCKETISLPVHEFIKSKDINYMIGCIKKFYSK